MLTTWGDRALTSDYRTCGEIYLTLPHLITHVDISAAGPLRIGTEMLNSRNIQWPVGHNFPFYFEAEAMQLRANLIANITNAFMMLTPP